LWGALPLGTIVIWSAKTFEGDPGLGVAQPGSLACRFSRGRAFRFYERYFAWNLNAVGYAERSGFHRALGVIFFRVAFAWAREAGVYGG
jgi:hypothetical protein